MAVFVDTGAWFTYFVRRDPDHQAARAWMRQNRQLLVPDVGLAIALEVCRHRLTAVE